MIGALLKSAPGIGIVEITINKAERRLSLVSSDGSERIFSVALGKNATVDKAVEGDHATPLGEFYVCAKNPRSKFFLSVCISYPNAEDAARGLTDGLISVDEHRDIIAAIELGKMPPQHTRLGGEIYIHGRESREGSDGQDASDGRGRDWTRGCIALDNGAMQELYDLVDIGTRVRILP